MMCGILGIINKKNRPIDTQTISKMMDTINYRGPDDRGCVAFRKQKIKKVDLANKRVVYFDLLLAHNRLSIIDLSQDGHQPFSSQDLKDRYWIVYNGEVYNYLEIRSELERLGHRFYTKSDTEVVLKAYVEWGDEAPKRFNGMWAILIYDIKKQTVWVSRDRLGKKPLYYYESGDYFLFASEIKQFMPLVALKENRLETQAIMLTDYRGDSTQTPFEGVLRFPYSQSALIDIDTPKLKFHRYWGLTYDASTVYEPPNGKKIKQNAEKFFYLLEDAVRIRLRSDVPVALTLSGGIDSNTILQSVHNLNKEHRSIATFSHIFENKALSALNEKKLIESATQGMKHTQYWAHTDYTDLEHFIRVYREKIRAYDAPMSSIGFSGYSVYNALHENGYKVVLEGQGADEMLAGYDGFWSNYFQVMKPYKIQEALSLLLHSNSTLSAVKNITKGLFYNTYAAKSLLPFVYRKLLQKRASMMNTTIDDELFEYMYHRDNVAMLSDTTPHNLNDTLIHSVKGHLSYLLYTADRDAMMFSVESRLPYLDYRLIEFVLNLPESHKMHNGYTKYLSRVAFEGKIPDSVLWNRKKVGYPDAMEYYVQQYRPLRELVIRILKNHDRNGDYEAMIEGNFRQVQQILADLFFKEQFFGASFEF